MTRSSFRPASVRSSPPRPSPRSISLARRTPQAAQPARRRRRQPQAPSFRAGVDVVSLNVTVTDGTDALRHRPRAGGLQVFEDGVKQDVTFFNRPTCRSRSRCCSTPAPAWRRRLPTAQEAAIGFARRLRPQDLAEIVDFDSRVVVLQPFTNDARRARAGDPQDVGRRLDVAAQRVYIALKDLKKIVAKNADEIRRQAIVVLSDGEDTSSLLPFEEVLDLAKRSETAIYAIGLRSTDEPRHVARASRKPSSSCASSRRKPAAARSSRSQIAELAEHLRPDRRRALEPVHGRLHVANRRATAPGAASSSASSRPNADRAHQAGILRADARRARRPP